MNNKKEANLISFKVLLTKDNKIVTELAQLPLKEVDNCFPVQDRVLIKALLRRANEKLKPIHRFLEREADAL